MRVPIDYAVNYDEAKQIAEKMAAGLPTRQELIESGAHEADGLSFFTYALNEEGVDMVQMGNGQKSVKERYSSLRDECKDGLPAWVSSNKPMIGRPHTYIYAKRC